MIWLIGIWIASGLAGWWLFEKSLLTSRGEVTMMDRSFVISLALLGPACLLVGVLSMVSAKWPEDRVLRTLDVDDNGPSVADGITREICDNCGRESAVGFTVPDEIWERVRGDFVNILCVACFAMRGDALNLEWDKDIQFWPVSKITLDAL